MGSAGNTDSKIYEICPKCKKKGYYTHTNMSNWSGAGYVSDKKMCKYCGYIEEVIKNGTV